jgi:hypothetical protein
MREPGIDADESGDGPSRRADPPAGAVADPHPKGMRSSRTANFLLRLRKTPAAEKTVDYTILEGEPTDRADIGLPIDLPRKAPGLAAAVCR